MAYKLFNLIEENQDSADFCAPISEENIAKAETMLGLQFPKSYREFLKRYGAGDILGIEFYGIINDPTTDSPKIPNGIWLTLNLRDTENLPLEYIAISSTGYGPYYVIDTSVVNSNGEAPVLMWDSENPTEKTAEDFDDFATTLISEML